MAYTQIKRTQLLKTDIDTLWEFISSPKNLQAITPKSMRFKITSDNKDEKMYPGMIISYKVAPILSIPMTWVTEITQVKEHAFFIDNQVIGPYKLWHHQHIFTQTKEGILMEDIISYTPPFGIIGKIANLLFIKRKVESIFDFRFKILEERFNK